MSRPNPALHRTRVALQVAGTCRSLTRSRKVTSWFGVGGSIRLDVRFARDAHGKPTASSPPPIEAVGAFFERDVARDPGLGDWILEAMDDVLARRETGATQVGTTHNHSYVSIDDSNGGFVEVCCDLGESGGPYQDVRKDRLGTFLDCEVPIPDFRAALVDWLAFLRDDRQEGEP
jgi:hypothetical protein